MTGLPHDSDPARTVALVTAELAANAVRHGSLPGRDFRLALLILLPYTLRIEVTDTRPERLPSRTTPQPADETSGRDCFSSRPAPTAGDARSATRSRRPSGRRCGPASRAEGDGQRVA